MTHLSLFTGIGGLDLAAEWAGFTTVGQCEWADYPTRVLEKHWPNVPRWRDIRELSADDFRRRTELDRPTIISGGFPCQPFSVAGKQKGKGDDRYLWPEMLRVITELAPRWVVGENVPGILRIAADDVCADLERAGYDVGIFDYEAAAVGAPHRRERIIFVANARCRGRGEQGDASQQQGRTEVVRASEALADSNSQRQQSAPGMRPESRDRIGYGGEDVVYYCCKRRKELDFTGITDYARHLGRGRDEAFCYSECEPRGWVERRESAYRSSDGCWRPTEPDIRGVADGPTKRLDRDQWRTGEWPGVPRVATGVKNRVGRLKCLGNAVVPQQFYPIFRAIAEVESS